MRRHLTVRLEALEALPPPQPVPEQNEPLFFESALAKLIEKEDNYKALDAAGRIRHWRAELSEDESAMKEPAKPPGSVRRPPGCSDAGHRILVDLETERPTPFDLAEDRWNLLEAQLDRLEELSYDARKLAEWRKAHESFRKIPWQWCQECLELTGDALTLLDEGPAKE